MSVIYALVAAVVVATPAENVRQRAGRHLHDNAGEGGGTHHEPDEQRAGAEFAREQR